MGIFILDGYTETGYIAESPGLHGELRFRYRPALTEESSEFYESVDKLKAKEADRHTAKFLAGKMVDWELRYPEHAKSDLAGRAVDLSAANIARLNRTVFRRLIGIVVGTQPSDPDPLSNGESLDSLVDAKLASSQQKPLVVAREEQDAGN